MNAQCDAEIKLESLNSGARYRLVPLVRYAAGNGAVLLYSQFSGESRIVPERAAEQLLSCTHFATLNEHARNLEARFGGAPETLLEELRAYALEGFFVSDLELISSCMNSGSNGAAKTQITSIGIPTRNRPDLLLRAVTSYLADRQKYGRVYRLVVTDASDEEEGQNDTKKSLAACAAEDEDAICYAGLCEKQQYASLLVDAGLPSDVVNFALFGDPRLVCAIGSNRNALLLETAGEILMSADDDSVCRLVSAPEFCGKDVRFAADNDAVQVQFFPGRESLLAASLPVEESVVSAHEELIGRTLGELLAGYDRGDEIGIDGICPHLLASMRKGVGTVITTYLGIWGDAGMGSPLAFLLDARGKRQKLVESESDLQCALSSREVMMVARQATVSHAGPWLGNGFAADNRGLLPPFPPNQRGEDTVFGQILSTCFSDSYFGHLPRALLHDPPPGRSYPAQATLGFSDVLNAFIGSTATWFRGGSPCKTLRQLGNYLVEISSSSQKTFDDELRKLLLRRTSFMLAMIDRDIARYRDAPALWTAEMHKVMKSLREKMCQRQMIPSDLKSVLQEEEAGSMTRELTLKFGKLLCWWPEIIQAARWLHSRGQRLAQRLTRVTERSM